ncbi:integrase [Halorientalis sp. IM1011]|uniref:tyrosine-type recombinase/integrase n=1 Tax=Halorientalis sp. IM1011 TaxID=1932360 RepID=UPI00097CC58A|nr:tyrosine-type recombinase/integrase [Halorientalis sp. IM1011]AQL41627.1 integrase [Halorientalis sp. IM1011]
MSDDLEPLSPFKAVDLYLKHRESELSEKSLSNQRYRLDSFVEWCEKNDVDNLNDLTGRDLHHYRTWKGQDVNAVTLRGILATLRKFLEFCASIDAVESGMRERVMLPELDEQEASRDIQLSEDRANEILDYLDDFAYASRDHVIVAILWHTGIRLGTLRAIDLDDWFSDEQALQIRHRPETETPLKNGKAAERQIAVGEYYTQVIDDYVEYHRYDVVDNHGRRPLISSEFGRLTAAPIRRTLYDWTRPCVLGKECPHDKDPDSCDAANYRESWTECPSSRSPHAVRRGSITWHLREGAPEEVVSDRMNASREVLEEHYDERSERERMQLRRELLDEVNDSRSD